jgi:hypothetical protein
VQHVPIPTVISECDHHCCHRKYIPLDLAFARTIHKFQGLSAGPVDPGKIPNMYECIICDPDIKGSEKRATGLFYTALSRATTLGDEDGLHSAIYFIGSNITRDRIQRVTMQQTVNKEYVAVTRRRNWMAYLKSHTVPIGNVNTKQVNNLFNWTKKSFPYCALHEKIAAYISIKNNS